MHNPILVALDVARADEALQLVETLAGTVGGFKIGSELFIAAGPDIVRKVRERGVPVFLDLKFHDIPHTVAKAVTAAVQLDVQFLTIHTCGGREMMQAAEQAAQEAAQKRHSPTPLVLGVTVLTSLDSQELSEIGFQATAARQVERLAALAQQSGLRGLVCSPLEIAALRQLLPSGIKLVTPGIRPSGGAMNDQKRTLTPKEALDAGADWLVIGRPIGAAPDPRKAAENILSSLK
jgi:orotidine-5'-phosphate decarboxylase